MPLRRGSPTSAPRTALRIKTAPTRICPITVPRTNRIAMHVFRAVSLGCHLHAKFLPSWNMLVYRRERGWQFPLNNLESVLVRDFLLHSLICIIPRFVKSLSTKGFIFFYFYFILRGHRVCPPPGSYPLTVHLGTTQASISGVLCSVWAVFQWQGFVDVCEILALRVPISK